MTCILGMCCPNSGSVILSGDSSAIDGNGCLEQRESKVFLKGPFAIGYTTSFRMGDILQYHWDHVESFQHGMDVRCYMVKKVVPELYDLFKLHDFGDTKDGKRVGGSMLIGYRHRLFAIHDDFQVAESTYGFDAIGAASREAKAAVAMYKKMTPVHSPTFNIQQCVELAMESALALNVNIRYPFTFVKSPSW